MAKTTKPDAPAAMSRPYLKSVHLRGVPPLRDVKASFQPGLNIIIGPNGAGKTQFMRLVSELVDSQKEKHRGVGSKIVIGGAEEELTATFKEQPVSLLSSKKYHIPRSTANASSLLVVAKFGGEYRESEFFTEAARGLLSEYFDYEVVAIWHGLPPHRLCILDEAADMSYNDSGAMSLTNIPYGAWMRGGVLERTLMDALAPFDVGRPANKFVATDLETIRLFITNGINTQLEQLNNLLDAYSPLQGVRLGQQFQVYRNTAKDELLIKGVALEYSIGGDWLPFSALSDGTKRVFYMISELVTIPNAFWNEGYTNQDAKADFPDKIILLEEPELGIHPKQLAKLLQLIREVSKENQVILTTHSPQTLDMLTAQELDRITICEYVPGKGTQLRKLSAEKKKKARAYLKDEGFLSEFWRFSNLESPD